MKTMIFAAGLGTRLKPLTDTLPKALVPVCGKPLLSHILDRLSVARDADGNVLTDGVVVNVHHFADKIEKWIDDNRGRYADVFPIGTSDERSRLLETGGGILNAAPMLEGCGKFLVHNVDILSDLNLAWFASQARPDALATLLVSDRRTSRYLLFDPRTMRLSGWTNVVTGEVRSPYLGSCDVPESISDDDGAFAPSKCLRLAFSGIHILSDSVFDIMRHYVSSLPNEHEKSPARFPIIDFYLAVAGEYPVYGVLSGNLRMVDVGKVDSLDIAEDFVRNI